jgi:hypothetical protein
MQSRTVHEQLDTQTDLRALVRARAAELRELLQHIELHIDDQHQHAKAASDVDEMQRLQDADPYRWLADAKHSLQSGLMFAERAISQPTSF